MQIRFASKTDVPVLKKFLIEMWLMHSDNEPAFMNAEYIKKSMVEKYLAPCFKKFPKSFIFIAENKNELAGFLKVDIESIEKFFFSPRVLYLDDLYVTDQYRRTGVAKILMEKAEELARKKGLKMLKARIYTFNTPSQSLFKLFSYKPLYSEWFKIL